MSAVKLITELRAMGVELWPQQGQLKYRAAPGLLEEEHFQRLRQHKEQILELLQQDSVSVQAAPQDAGEPFPLTDVQRAYLLGREASFGHGNVACHGYLELSWPRLQPVAVQRAWNRLIERHGMLRAVISAQGSQRVLDQVPEYQVQTLDLRGQCAEEQTQSLETLRQSMSHKVYPTEQWPLFELRLSQTEQRDTLHFSMDSLLADWASAQILFSELEQLIVAADTPLPDLQISFRDYLLAERKLLQGSRFQRDREYWMARVDQFPAAPCLPVPLGQNEQPARFRRYPANLPASQWQALRQAAGERGLTPSVTVLAAYASVLQRWSEQPEFTLNVTLLNRMPLHAQVNQLVGDFTSVSLLHVATHGEYGFVEQAREIGARLFNDLEHRLFSGIQLMREIGRRHGREAGAMPVVFTSAIGLGATSLPGSQRTLGYGITQTPQVTLDCQVMDDADGLHIHWDVRQGVFPDGLIEDMLNAFSRSLQALADTPEAWQSPLLAHLPDWQQAERDSANATCAPLPSGLLHECLPVLALERPDDVALIASDGQLTWSELYQQAINLAACLQNAGCHVHEPIAILLDKGIEQVIAVYGTLLAGCAYLPIDPAMPCARRNRVLNSAGVRLAVAGRHPLSSELPEAVTLLCLDQLPDAQSYQPIDLHAEDLAYVIYTSGSTGEPKGVMVSHRAAVNTVQDINRRFAVNAQERILGLARLSFDLSVYDLFGALDAGATLILPDPARGADPSHWAQVIREQRVTLWNSVPAQMQMLSDYLRREGDSGAASSLRLGLLSGDWIPLNLPASVQSLLPELQLISLGGATEAAIWSNYHRIVTVDPSWRSIPYGKPLSNQGFRVLDSQWRDAPTWVAGELFITGTGLADGYLGDEALSAQRFFPHPVDGQRLYRTGDRARYLPGGELEFLGRDDGQVKIRGYRVELGEVESALLEHQDVETAVSLLTTGDNGERSLLAFVTPASTRPGEVDRQALVTAATRYADRQVPEFTHQQVMAYRDGLHQAALANLLQVMQQVGLFQTADVDVNDSQVIAALQTSERHHWLVRRWLQLLCDAGWLQRNPATGGYRSQHKPQAPSWDDLQGAVEQELCSQTLLDYLRDHGRQLPQLLSGEVNPFDLLFPQGDQSMARALYRDDAISRYTIQATAALINRLATHHQGPGPLRIIEIGAGTGATSESVIPLLDGLEVDYLFSDITPMFIAQARQRFADYPWVRFSVLDIDQDIRPQGLASHSADIVLCAGMLNSVQQIDTTLTHITELLAPGGWLLFTEPGSDSPHILLSQGFMMQSGETSAGLQDAHIWQTRMTQAGGEWLAQWPATDHPLAQLGSHLYAVRFKSSRKRLLPEPLRQHLNSRLPDYMVPAHIQILDQMPLTTNGKVDRKRLAGWRPAIDTLNDDAPQDVLDPLAAQLCAMWAEALGIERIGTEDNFFDKGADSLILAMVAGRLREEVSQAQAFTYDSLLRQMLNEPTVAALQRRLQGGESLQMQTMSLQPDQGRRTGSNALLVPFGGGDQGPLRVMFHAALGTLDYFQHLGQALAQQQVGPVVGIAVADTEQYLAHAPHQLIERVADDYAQRLLDEGHSRFQLIGYCLGGLLATEVARRLSERGAEVLDLSLIDSIPMFIDTDEELAYEAIFVPNLNLDPVKAVFGEQVRDDDVYRAIELLMDNPGRQVAQGAMAALQGDAGLQAVAQAVRQRSALSQAQRLAHYAELASGQAGVPISAELIPTLFNVCRHSMRAARFDPPPYLGNITYLRCLEQQSFGITAGVGHLSAPFWEQVCLGDFRLIDVPGNHFSVIEPPHVKLVTEHLLQALEARA
ncbi:non-ribosomal peptide synthetase [Pseudomonas sp. PA27(2017)]|uniref:non-ribosomal peptide synthetase n=1 Tax=Pseudomonas sp. PA27(2017) TaxID=1932112 RepID=UPI00096920D2|nr:non-ribosomal peptide synthetase [Pseudomonas sp. PA27(2017)]OLU33797.1 non-ribosomal peptide synthetase [Pseudomonas sp. PA27(2017)]